MSLSWIFIVLVIITLLFNYQQVKPADCLVVVTEICSVQKKTANKRNKKVLKVYYYEDRDGGGQTAKTDKCQKIIKARLLTASLSISGVSATTFHRLAAHLSCTCADFHALCLCLSDGKCACSQSRLNREKKKMQLFSKQYHNYIDISSYIISSTLAVGLFHFSFIDAHHIATMALQIPQIHGGTFNSLSHVT